MGCGLELALSTFAFGTEPTGVALFRMSGGVADVTGLPVARFVFPGAAAGFAVAEDVSVAPVTGFGVP